MPGLFISFEGIDGCGKTTQVERVAEIIRGTGRDVVSVRDPGSTRVAELVRNMLLDRGNSDIDARTELFLYLACRAELVERCIRPALGRGQVVVSDRFSDSTLAYQGSGRMLGVELVRQANRIATAGLTPNVTLLIDIPVNLARNRRGGKIVDRLEAEDGDFHERVRNGFLEIARREPDRVAVLDGTLPVDDVTNAIVDTLALRVPVLLGDVIKSS